MENQRDINTFHIIYSEFNMFHIIHSKFHKYFFNILSLWKPKLNIFSVSMYFNAKYLLCCSYILHIKCPNHLILQPIDPFHDFTWNIHIVNI